MLERVQLIDDDVGEVLVFRNTKAMTVEVSVSRLGIFCRTGFKGTRPFSYFALERLHAIPFAPNLAPLIAIAKAHLPRLLGHSVIELSPEAEREIFEMESARSRRAA